MRGLNPAAQDILWVGYAAAVSQHRANDRKPGMPAQRRTDRLTSTTTLDNRASPGWIKVSVPLQGYARASPSVWLARLEATPAYGNFA